MLVGEVIGLWSCQSIGKVDDVLCSSVRLCSQSAFFSRLFSGVLLALRNR